MTDDNFCLSICNALDLIAPLSGQFNRRFNSFSTRIHRQYFLIASKIAEFLVKRAELVIPKGTGSERNSACLFDQCLLNPGMCMTLIDCGIGAEAVKITLTIDIRDPHA